MSLESKGAESNGSESKGSAINYFVTGLETIVVEPSGFVFVGDVYCCGYFTTLIEAIETMAANSSEIIERGYLYVVIEALPAGYQVRPERRYLYQYDKYIKQFVSIPEPEGFKKTLSIYCL